MTKLKTIIVDDHKIFRTGLKLLLSRIKIVEIIGEACDASELFLFVEKQRPDLVFMDLNLPGMSGIEATEKLIKLFPDIKIVVISSFDDNDTVQKVLQAGGMAYLIKNTDYEDVVEAIAQVMKGRKYFSPEILDSMSNQLTNTIKPIQPEFTIREMEILKYICKGNSTEQIAEKNFISKRTVEKHKQNLMKKTKSHSTSSLIIYALKHKLVEKN